MSERCTVCNKPAGVEYEHMCECCGDFLKESIRLDRLEAEKRGIDLIEYMRIKSKFLFNEQN